MAGISEAKAESAMRQGKGFAKHLGVKPGSDRYNAIVYGTKRAKGWYPRREAKSHGLKAAVKDSRKRHGKR